MSANGQAPRSARLVSADERGGVLVFEATRPCRAAELLFSLGVSKAAAGRMFARSQLRREDGGRLDAQAQVEPGERLSVRLDRPALPDSAPLSGAAGAARPRVLYEDPFILAVDKPAGLLVHGDGTGAPTLTGMVRACLRGRGVPCEPQAVQRLDLETTGVVLFSKTSEFQSAFDALVAGHGDIRKLYLAVVRGAVPPGRRVFSEPLSRDRHDARRMRVGGGPRAEAAVTRVEPLAADARGAHSLVRAELGTGRRHQIRVHLAAHGHPVVNDELYGTVETGDGLMLHAYEESFTHPVTGDEVRACAGWPARFSRWFAPRDAGLAEGLGAAEKGAGLS